MPDSSRSRTRRDVLRITATAGVWIAFAGGLAVELVQRARLHRVSAVRAKLGTLVDIAVLHPDPTVARTWIDTAFAEMDRLERILSRHDPASPMAGLNRDGMLAEAPDELLLVLERASVFSVLSDGAFDVSVAPVLAAYNAAAEIDDGLPNAATLEAALALVGHQDVAIHGRRVHLRRPGMSLTLDGIAKGFVVDRTLAVLTAAGADRVLVDAGGDMATGGEGSRREPWTVAVQDPRDPDRTRARVTLRGTCVATSGDYIQTFTEDRRAHHVIDPRTGRSPEHAASVTVVASSAMDADALSTTVMVLGPRAGIELLDRIEDVEGLIVTKDGASASTRGFGS